MSTVGINYWAVLVGGGAYWLLGALWYSPALFGNAWMKGVGKTKEQIAAGASPFNYIWGLITSLVAAYGIARIMIWTGRDSIADGITVSLLVGVCFVLTSLSVNDVFEGRPRSLSVINILYHIVGFVIIGIILGAW